MNGVGTIIDGLARNGYIVRIHDAMDETGGRPLCDQRCQRGCRRDAKGCHGLADQIFAQDRPQSAVRPSPPCE